ncbi:hypothetical protein CLV63_112100 [Murinocardiopsis flavida]|uniref:Uncharacterized protein n=1 Tax=Murinocardiopsis flavida TaxID=645275 RepID=A0A2P8DG92_9ACTN|nr:hypothetical protein [Murinocardiopsis flavida]PSK96218.1 hypothetical protein CLV63_112100 [Murinocardiopsis flavida]
MDPDSSPTDLRKADEHGPTASPIAQRTGTPPRHAPELLHGSGCRRRTRAEGTAAPADHPADRTPARDSGSEPPAGRSTESATQIARILGSGPPQRRLAEVTAGELRLLASRMAPREIAQGFSRHEATVLARLDAAGITAPADSWQSSPAADEAARLSRCGRRPT